MLKQLFQCCLVASIQVKASILLPVGTSCSATSSAATVVVPVTPAVTVIVRSGATNATVLPITTAPSSATVMELSAAVMDETIATSTGATASIVVLVGRPNVSLLLVVAASLVVSAV